MDQQQMPQMPPAGAQPEQPQQQQNGVDASSPGPMKNVKKRGLCRLPIVRKLVTTIIDTATLRLTALETKQPAAGRGLEAKVFLKISDTGTGPLPIHVKLKFVQAVQLHWKAPESQEGQPSSAGFVPGTSRPSRAGRLIANATLDDLKLRPSQPGVSAGSTELKVDHSLEAAQRTGDLVKALLRTPAHQSVTLIMRASNVTVKAYGITFPGLHMEKELVLAGLGALGGTVSFPYCTDPIPDSDGRPDPAIGSLAHAGAASQNHLAAPAHRASDVADLRRCSVEKAPRKSFFSTRSRAKLPKMRSRLQVSQEADEGPRQIIPARIIVENLEVCGGNTKQGILVSAVGNIHIDHPAKGLAPVLVDIGTLALQLCAPTGSNASGQDGLVRVGQLTMRSCGGLLKPGANAIHADGAIRLPAHLPPGSDSHRAAFSIIPSLLQNESIHMTALAEEPTMGQAGISPAQWVSYGFGGAHVAVTLPPLGDKAAFLDGAQLRAGTDLAPPSMSSFDQTSTIPSRTSKSEGTSHSAASKENDAALVRTIVRNSFGVEIVVQKLRVVAYGQHSGKVEGQELGTIETPEDWLPLRLGAKDSSPVTLPFKLNTNPSVLVRLLRETAAREQFDLGAAFLEILDMLDADGSTQRFSHAGEGCEDFPYLLTQALASLRVTAVVEASKVLIGDYEVPGPVTFYQHSLAIAISGSTASWILPRVGAPLVTRLIEGGRIGINSVDVLDLDEGGLTAKVALELSNYGPLNALVFLESPLQLLWEEGPKAGQVAAVFAIREPLFIDPKKSHENIHEVNVHAARGAGVSSTLADFVSTLLQNETSQWRMEASFLRIVAGGVDYTSNLSKPVKIGGFGGFRGIKADRFDILGEVSLPPSLAAQLGRSTSGEAAKGLSVQAKVQIPNTSTLSTNLSRLDMDLFIGDVQIGQITALDVRLAPGSLVTVKAAGYVAGVGQTKLLGDLVTDILVGKTVQIRVQGRSALMESSASAYRRQASAAGGGSRTKGTKVAWLDAALRQLSVDVELGPQTHDIIKRLEVEGLKATIPASGDPCIAISALIVKYKVPYPLQVAIESVMADVEILLDGVVVGRGSTKETSILDSQVKADSRRRAQPNAPQQIDAFSGVLKLAVSDLVLHSQSEAFPALLAHVFTCKESDRISLRGKASIVAKVVLGRIPFQVDLGPAQKLKIRGMRSLKTSPTEYTGLQVVAGTNEYLKVIFDLFINNPSKHVSLTLPDSGLSFAAFYRGAYVGRAIVAGRSGPCDLNVGPCAFRNVEFLYAPKQSEEKAVRQLPANFLSGKTTTLEIRGDDESTPIAALRPALKSLQLSFDLKPLVDRTLIASIEITLGSKVLTSNAVECEFVISNPLNMPIDLLSLAFVANYKGRPFGTASLTWPEDAPLRVASGSLGKPGHATGQCLVTLAQRLDRLVRAFLSERGQLYLQVDLRAGVEMGGFKIPTFEYTQERLPLNIKNLSTVSKLLWAIPG